MRATALLVALSLSRAALACEGLEVKDAWIREAPPGASVMAGYAELRNGSAHGITIDGARSADFGDVEIHRMEMAQGQMRMRHEPRVLLEPDATLALEPGGLHLMLMEPKRKLKSGDRVQLKIDCEGKSLTTEFIVRPGN